MLDYRIAGVVAVKPSPYASKGGRGQLASRSGASYLATWRHKAASTSNWPTTPRI